MKMKFKKVLKYTKAKSLFTMAFIFIFVVEMAFPGGMISYANENNVNNIPDWGKKMTHPSLLKNDDIVKLAADIKNGEELEDYDNTNIGTSLENVWKNVVNRTNGYMQEDYYLASNRFCLYHPYVLQPVSWANISSMQVGDSSTPDSNAQRPVTGITASTYYVNFDVMPIYPETAKNYILYSGRKDSNPNGVIIKMDASKVYVSDGSSDNFVAVKGANGNDLMLSAGEEGRWYNIFLIINSGIDKSTLIIHPRGASLADSFKVNFTAFGDTTINGIFLGCQGTDSIGTAHYDNVRIYDTFEPVVEENFDSLDAWTVSGKVAKSNKAAYESTQGQYYWTFLDSDLQDRLQSYSITYYVKKLIGDADADVYFNKAKILMLSIAHWDRWGDPDEREKSSLDLGYITTGMSYAYDLLYQDLTAEERAFVANAIKTKGVDAIYSAAIDPLEYACYDGYNMANNTTLVENSGLGIGALVVGDTYNTDEQLAVVRKNLNSCYKNGVDEDGGWIEGFIYGDLALVNSIPFHDADNRITGDNMINNGYLTKIIDYAIYNQLPGGKYYSNLGDNDSTLSYQYKKIMEYYTKTGNNKYTGWCLKRLGSLPNSSDMLSLAYFPTGAKVVEPTEDTLSLGKLFSTMGVATLKTGWGTTDSLMTLKSSKLSNYLWFHTHCDENSIELMRGTSYLLCDPGYQAWSGPSRIYNQGSIGHNTLMLNGASQNCCEWSSDWTPIFGGQIENYFVGDKYGFSVGSAALAYTDLTSGTQTIPEWRRSIVDMIDSDYYVLFDDYQTAKENMDLVWQLHTQGKWKKNESSNAMITTINNDQLAVIFLNADVNDFAVNSDADYGYKNVRVLSTTLKTGKENNNLLALLYPSDKGAALPTTKYLADSDDNGVIVNTSSSTDVVLFHKDSVDPVILSKAVHYKNLKNITVDNTRVNKIVMKYTAITDTQLLQDGKVIGTLIGDGTERIDSFVLNSSSTNNVTLTTNDSVTVSDVWCAGTTKLDVATKANSTITLPNPDSYYDLKIKYSGAKDAFIYQNGVVIGKLTDGAGTSSVQLQKPYSESVIDGVRTATAKIEVIGASTYDIEVAENESRNRIGRVLDVGGDNDTEYADLNVSGMSIVGDKWSGKLASDTTYRVGADNAQMYVNSPSTRNSYTVYLKYKSNTNVPVYQYSSSKDKTQLTELTSSSTWRVASFNLKEYGYSALDIGKDQVIHRLLEFGKALDVDSAWIELRESDIQVDYTDVGNADDRNVVKHNPGLVIGSNFEEATDSKVSTKGGTILTNIRDTDCNYYVNIKYTSESKGTIKQLLDASGKKTGVVDYKKGKEESVIRFKLDNTYYDSDSSQSGINILLTIDGDITIYDMWLDKEVKTLYE